MLHNMSEKITDFLLLKKSITFEEKDIYIYGVELVTSSVINLSICLIIGLCLDEFLNSVLFFVIFCSLRKFSGGYHCMTYLKCNILFSIIVLSSLLISKYVDGVENIPLMLTVMMITILVIFCLAPVEHPNKQIDKKENKKYKIISLGIVLIHIISYLFMLVGFNKRINIIIICDLFVAIMMIFGYIKDRRWKNEII